MHRYSLAQAMELDPALAAKCRTTDPARFDEAVSHHTKRHLVADVAKGTTRDRDGFRSAYTAYDWSARYQTHPQEIFHDFFLGHVMNSVSRLQRGLCA